MNSSAVLGYRNNQERYHGWYPRDCEEFLMTTTYSWCAVSWSQRTWTRVLNLHSHPIRMLRCFKWRQLIVSYLSHRVVSGSMIPFTTSSTPRTLRIKVAKALASGNCVWIRISLSCRAKWGQLTPCSGESGGSYRRLPSTHSSPVVPYVFSWWTGELLCNRFHGMFIVTLE